MADDGVIFDSQSAQRIAGSVLYTEQQRKNDPSNKDRGRGNRGHVSVLTARVRNKTGVVQLVGWPLALVQSEEDRDSTNKEFRTGDVFQGNVPSTDNGHIGVTLEEIPVNGVGPVAISGAVSVWANIVSQAHLSVTVSGGTFVSSTTGFPIVDWKSRSAQDGSIQLGWQYVQIILNDRGQKQTSGDYPIIFIEYDGGLPLLNRSIVGIGGPIAPYPTQAFPNDAELPLQPGFHSTPPQQGVPFAILLSGASKFDVVQAVTVGVVAVQVNYTSASHAYADVEDQNYYRLKSSSSGPAFILWRQNAHLTGNATFGVQWALVSLTQTPRASDDYRGVIVSPVGSASVGTQQPGLPASIRPGTGLAQLYNAPGSFGGQPPQGTPWDMDSGFAVRVENWMFGAIDLNKPVLLRFSRVNDQHEEIYTIVAQGCAPVPTY
jgi:hypothetical protein